MAKDLSHITSVIAQMRDIKNSITRLQERYDLMKNLVVNELAGETAGQIDGRPVVTHTIVTSRRFDAKAFAQAQPETYENFRVESQSSRFILVDPDVDNG